MKHVNLKAYDSYELFDDSKIESRYRDLKLKSCQKHVDLLRSEFNNKKLNILEIGSGNSKLLINLFNQNLLNYGYGIEISESRYNFAEKWIKDLNINNIKNINEDVINFNYDEIGEIDVCICVDLCFQFLEPIKINSAELILNKIYNKIIKGGKIIIELDYCGNIINNLPYTNRIWEEFPDSDPWKYSLWECNYNELTKILNWKKTFISKKNEYETTSIDLKIYDSSEIEELLNKVGFKNIIIYNDWNYSKFEKNFGEFVIIAEK